MLLLYIFNKKVTQLFSYELSVDQCILGAIIIDWLFILERLVGYKYSIWILNNQLSEAFDKAREEIVLFCLKILF